MVSEPGQRHAALTLVFSAAIFVRGFADFVRLEKYDLRYALIRIDLRRQGRGVGKLERNEPFPFRFKGCDIYQDSASRVSTFAETHGQDVPGDAKVFHRARKRKTVWRNQYRIGFHIDEILRIKLFRINDRAVDVGEELEFIGAADVVTVARRSV